jgi:uncharacterized protein (UPF0305 family)
MVNDGYEKTDVKEKKKVDVALTPPLKKGRVLVYVAFWPGAPLKPGILEFGGGVDVRGVSRL